MAIKLKHYVVWYDMVDGPKLAYRTKHSDMETLVNKIVNTEYYEPSSLQVIVGTEVLTPETGKELL